MKTTLQKYRTGELLVVETPIPQSREGWIKVQTAFSVISAGTEKTKIDTARKSLLGKAMARPDLLKQVVRKAQREGLWKTWQTVSDRLDTPTPLGYSCSGTVIEVSGDGDGVRLGDRVACAGSTANHAEIVNVPRNLVVPVPETVRLDHAAFATLGAIAMQAVRQAEVRLGERVALIGLGLIGLLTAQLLRANGCRVFGIDLDPSKLALAKKLGCAETAHAKDPSLEEQILMFTDGYGVDATIIAAGAPSNEPIEAAAAFTREKGRVIVLGLTKMDVPRDLFYHKEIDLRMSRSYGPGRYDRNYEEQGHDYPYAYVRFTEQRNMACFLDLVEGGQVQLEPIITHRFDIDRAADAYGLIHGAAREPYLGILLEYHRPLEKIPTRIELKPASDGKGPSRIGVIGAGKYATTYLLPHLKDRTDCQLGLICTGTGTTALQVAQNFGFSSVESSPGKVIEGSDAILVATRHHDHAELAVAAIRAGKPVFVEKPLVVTEGQLDDVKRAAQESSGACVMVGFNRRFAPATLLAKEFFGTAKFPKHVVLRINAGDIPSDHWIHDPNVGGGRLIGEGCHFVDLAVAITGSCIKRVSTAAMPKPGVSPAVWDDFAMALEHADGSVSTLAYTSVGDGALAKERIEIHGGAKSAIIDDFQRLETFVGGKRTLKTWSRQDKGQQNEVEAWVAGTKTGISPIPFTEILNVHEACLAAIRSIQHGGTVELSS